MRIAFSGTANTGKSTLVRDFLVTWPMYNTPEKSYRDHIKTGKIQHSKSATQDGQRAILDMMCEQLTSNQTGDKIVYDRCPIDNLVYSMWANAQDTSSVSDEFVRESIARAREAIKKLDIIFWLPFSDKIPIQRDGVREADVQYIKEIDNIFQIIHDQYLCNDKFPIFDPEDRPAIIMLTETDRHNRLVEIANYINMDGNFIEPDTSWISKLGGGDADAELAKEAKEQLEGVLSEKKLDAFKKGVIV